MRGFQVWRIWRGQGKTHGFWALTLMFTVVVRHHSPRSFQTGRTESSSQENPEHIGGFLWIYLWGCSASWGLLGKSFFSAETLVLHLPFPAELLEKWTLGWNHGTGSWNDGTESWNDGTESWNGLSWDGPKGHGQGHLPPAPGGSKTCPTWP